MYRFTGLVAAASLVSATSPGLSGCREACSLLQQSRLTVDDVSSSSYVAEQQSYWSVFQGEVSPQCFVRPTCAEEVADVIKIAERTKCKFAVRSGGHAAFAGASSIEGGITIDLRLMNELTVSEDRSSTLIGPGNRWIDVYEYLTPMNLSVIGGRVAGIGIGGLTLGGGISFFSGRHGWACDGISNYELVTADGTILQVNYSSYPDLYFALRGGGNNFGIVTRFTVDTFEQGAMWGGALTLSGEYNATLLEALVELGNNAPEDPDAAAWVASVWVPSLDSYIINSELTYAKPVADPPILQKFTAVPYIESTLRISNMTNLAQELNISNPNGLRDTYWTITYKNDLATVQASLDIFAEEVEPIKNVTGIVPGHVAQVIPKNVIAFFSKNGGNCLGIDESDGPLININISISWAAGDDEADAAVLDAAARMINRMGKMSVAKGTASPYLYQNYAAKEQNVFAGYGERNTERLAAISKKYDPKQVFQKLQPGYFKLVM